MSPTPMLLRGATTIVVDEATERDGDLLLVDGMVAGAGDRPDAALLEELDVSGSVATGGLVNAHHHLIQTAFRTLPGTRGVPMATWLPTMAAACARFGVDPEVVGAAALAGAAEGLLCGVTTIVDHHLTWPAGAATADSVAVARAAADAAYSVGSRFAFVRGSARDDPQEAALLAEAIVTELVPARPGGFSADGMLQVAVGPAGVHSDSRETLR